MAINAEIRRSNAVNYAEVIHFKTNVGLVEGLLDLNGKIKSDFIPGYVLGSMRFGGVINSSGSLKEKVEEFINAETKDTSLGLYFICTADITLERTNPSTDPKSHGYIINVAGLEGGNNPASLESGDWIIYNRFDETFTVPTIIYTFSFDVINNTYRDATTTTKGIVQLASDTDGETGTNTTKAMTPKATVAAINKRAYVHPTFDQTPVALGESEIIEFINITNGHIASIGKIRNCSICNICRSKSCGSCDVSSGTSSY
jgi:hypothetical protein